MSWGTMTPETKRFLVGLLVFLLIIGFAYAYYQGYIKFEKKPAAIVYPTRAVADITVTLANKFEPDVKTVPSIEVVIIEDDGATATQPYTLDSLHKSITFSEIEFEDIDPETGEGYFYLSVTHTNPSFYLDFPAFVSKRLYTTKAGYTAYKVTVEKITSEEFEFTVPITAVPVGSLSDAGHQTFSGSSSGTYAVINNITLSAHSELRDVKLIMSINASGCYPIKVLWDNTELPITNMTSTYGSPTYVVYLPPLSNPEDDVKAFWYTIYWRVEKAGAYSITYNYNATNGLGEEVTKLSVSIVAS